VRTGLSPFTRKLLKQPAVLPLVRWHVDGISERVDDLVEIPRVHSQSSLTFNAFSLHFHRWRASAPGTGAGSNRVMSPKHGNSQETKMAKPMMYTSDGVPKNWDGKDWQTYKWAMLTVFEENGLKDIANGTLTETMLQAASAEKKEEFKLKQVKIKRMVGTSVPPEILQQVSDKKTGSEM